MNISQIIAKVRAASIRWELRRLEVQRHRTIREFILAVDYRIIAQREFTARAQCIKERKVYLESQLEIVKQELA